MKEKDLPIDRKRVMTAFFAVMAAALILIICVWNGVHDFLPAYLQALLFLEVMNWYDGIVIDRLWGGHCSRNHRIAFLGGIRYGTKRFGTSKEIDEHTVSRKGDLQTTEHRTHR